MRQRRLGKKGDAYEILWHIVVRLPYIAILFIIFMYINVNMTSTAMDSQRVNSNIISSRIIISPGALAYQDPDTGRVYPGIIDKEKFTQETIDAAFKVIDNTRIAARIELESISGEDLGSIYINENWYDRWTPYTAFERFDRDVFRKIVQIKTEKDIIPGVIKIHVVSPDD
ncbi:hypothetical protein JXC34_05640 [Candidatus Woesearchaeota archaeon]|nr:hypothetical protein [Candidatus Woesearchaeota archaeon]